MRAFAVDDDSTVYVLVPGSFRKTTDRGVTWMNLSAGLQYCYSLTVGPKDTIYAPQVYSPMRKSTDGGQTWISLDLPGLSLRFGSVAVSPFNPQAVYGSAYGWGIFRSEDGGLSWHGAGLSREARAYAFHPDSSILYVGLQTGIARTSDGGTTWTICRTGCRKRAPLSNWLSILCSRNSSMR